MEATVKSLRQQGYKVRVLHRRNYEYKHPPMKFDRVKFLSCKGGLTEVEVTNKQGESFFGIAKCALEDNYNKKLGVKIALGRALKEMNKPEAIKNFKKSVGKLREALDEYHKLH